MNTINQQTFKVQVNTYGDTSEDTWAGNAMTYNSESDAINAAKDLFMRWTAVRHYRVLDVNDTVVFRSDT
jgi:hypothetical protein